MPFRKTRTRSYTRRKYTPGTRTYSSTRTSHGATATTVGTPSTSTTVSGTSGGTPYYVPSGNTGLVIVLATGLFLFATWKDIGSPFLNSAIHNQPYSGLPYKTIIGGIVFIIAIGVIASTGPTASEVMVWMLVAMWLLFIMFNGSGALQTLLGSIQAKTSSSSSTSSGSNTPNQQTTNTKGGQ